MAFTSYKKLYAKSLVEIQNVVDKLNELKCVPQANFDETAYNNMLVAKDLVLCANRYVWKNIPLNLTSQQLESLFYKWGSLCFFEEDGHLMITRYTFKGMLTPFGQLGQIQPIDFGGKSYGSRKTVITHKGQKVKDGEKVAVIISDYTGFYAQEIESRESINRKTTINDQTKVYMQLSTNIMLSVKKALALCENEEQKNVVLNQMQSLFNPSTPVVPISISKGKDVSKNLPVEMFNFNNNFETQNYCQQIDYYDKVRRSFDGVPAPDTFEKKERKVVGETEDTTTHTNLVLDDGLQQRQLGLDLIKEYIHVDGIDKVSVDLTDTLKEKEMSKEMNDNDDRFNNNPNEKDIQES